MTITVTWGEIKQSGYIEEFMNNRDWFIPPGNQPRDEDEFNVTLNEASDWGMLDKIEKE